MVEKSRLTGSRDRVSLDGIAGPGQDSLCRKTPPAPRIRDVTGTDETWSPEPGVAVEKDDRV